jgi:radical SAM protein with 4Fe4S-binding SPASM domain
VDCQEATGLSNHEFLVAFNRKAAATRVPLSGTLELTRRCNVRCTHCYLGPQRDQWRRRQDEMTTGQVCAVLDQAAEAGCLYLLITGGDPLVRPDFPAVYRHARLNGLIVTLFTNGTLIDDEIAGLLAEYPPQLVELTLYGASAATFEKITGAPGSYRRFLEGLERLKTRQIRTRLKTILMTHNRHEFAAIKEMAEALGTGFRFDPTIIPTLDGDTESTHLRVEAREAARLEFVDDGRGKQWRDAYDASRARPGSDVLFDCGAGVSAFHIDPFGYLQPCLMAPWPRYNLLAGSFAAGWLELDRIHELKHKTDSPCRTCRIRELCGYCPGSLVLETGEPDIPVPFLCELGRARFQNMQSLAGS